jgi:hypothetical protein
MANRHVMTAKRKAALRKAQLASARKRRKAYLNSPHPSKKIQARYKKRGGKGQASRRLVRNQRILAGASIAFSTTGIIANVHTIKTKRYHSPTTRRDVIKGAARGATGFAKGFAEGYSGARQTSRVRKQNLSRMGGTTIHRVGYPALPGGGHKPRGGRRVRGY